MREYSIGEVARETGLAASALRFYEKEGLLPAPPRKSKQRRYDETVFGRIYVIKAALDAGFTIGETRLFLSGFPRETPPAARWQALASTKLDEVNALIARTQRMKALLETSFHCGCSRLEDCEKLIREARRKGAVSFQRELKPPRRISRERRAKRLEPIKRRVSLRSTNRG